MPWQQLFIVAIVIGIVAIAGLFIFWVVSMPTENGWCVAVAIASLVIGLLVGAQIDVSARTRGAKKYQNRSEAFMYYLKNGGLPFFLAEMACIMLAS